MSVAGAVLQAEAAVKEVNIIADASSGCSDLSVPENIAPPLSAHDKVVEFLCSSRNSERQEFKLSNGETDNSRESAALVQVQNKPSSEVDQCRLSEFSLGPMPNKLHFPPAKKASVVTYGPAVRDDFYFLFYLFYLYIYPPDSQESDGGAIHRVSNYPDLLPEMLEYCCPLVS